MTTSLRRIPSPHKGLTCRARHSEGNHGIALIPPAALVTGASYGIGAATALGLARDGFDVAVTDLTTESLARTVAAVTDAGSQVLALQLDLREQNSIEQAAVEAAAAFDHLEVLVNNAGVPSPGKPAIDVTRLEWEANIAVNLTGTFFMTTAFGRRLIKAGRQGCVVSLASAHGTVGFPGTSPYGLPRPASVT